MKKILIYTDGGSRGNPGPAGIGVVFCNEKGEKIKEYAEYLGENLTNNQAEYRAVIFALKKFKQVFGKELAKNSEIEIKTDSEFMAHQLNGIYKIMDADIQPLFIEVWNLMIDFKKVKVSYIPREKNTEADKLANVAMDSRKSEQKLF